MVVVVGGGGGGGGYKKPNISLIIGLRDTECKNNSQEIMACKSFARC